MTKSASLEIFEEEDDPLVETKQRNVHRWSQVLVKPLLISIAAAIAMLVTSIYRPDPPSPKNNTFAIAFIGNSMFYFNDFPRFFQALSKEANRYVLQNSCLHGGGSIPSLVLNGNSMYPQFATANSILNQSNGHLIYDFGACTVTQLLSKTDPILDNSTFLVPATSNATNKNPCREDPIYLDFSRSYFGASWQPDWDYVVINDNTRNPARAQTRTSSLQTIESFYLPWFQQSKATPILLWTQAYSVESTSQRKMAGLEDLANFTSLTYAGLKEYAKLLERKLPATQKPRIAPVGLAFLLVHEDNPEVWKQLFHSDGIHASPSGTFLQGCVVYHTLFGEMPPEDRVVRENMAKFWTSARMMQHSWEPPNPYPTVEMASYLYHVAERIMVQGELPRGFVDYQNGEVAFEG